jgi:CheY-like chemotaxis protein
MSESHSVVWLLAEDNEDEFILLQRGFRRVAPDAKLLWVKDGSQAKDYLAGEPPFQDRSAYPVPAVVLADLKMPRCNGIELLRWVRQHAEFRNLPFVVFSSSDQPSDVAAAYQNGANWYLTKPSTLDQLTELLRRLYEQFRLEKINKLDMSER